MEHILRFDRPLPDELAAQLRGLCFNDRTGTTAERDRITVENPFTGADLGWVPSATEEDVDVAFERARRAQKHWAHTPIKERSAILRRFHDLVLKNRDFLLDIAQLETGKNRASALDEVLDIAINARHYATSAARLLSPQRRRGAVPLLTKTYTYHRPKGVVGQISPWNYPLTLGISDALAAIAAGNAVVAKPDSATPFSLLACLRLLLEAGLPEDVLQVVTGSGRVVGTAIAQRCDYLMFTGSTATGKILGEICGKRLIGYSAELGGKNPMIVARDADIRRCLDSAVLGCLANSGQLCVSIERIYVEDAIYEEFTKAFAQRVAATKLGAGFGWDIEMGSLASRQQLDTVRAYVEDARDLGATVLTGGQPRPDLGPYFYEPTVLADVPEAARLRCEEVFGPVIYIERVPSVDKAIELCNDTDYGLNSSVLAAPATAWAVAPRIEAGSVNINDGFSASWGSYDSPLGGMKESGMAHRHGDEGLTKYTDAQTISEQRIMRLQGPRWLPRSAYAAIMSALLRAGKTTRLMG
ncbi:succinate-semialdehyde dehydrogenase (NADP(+)) [Corynebacterium sp. zg-331]|uniref:succinic semialdehyde dehydrogenase n=1 Tax=unclassified Corynebacterium TaxID=2624378 RepID=UPI00128D5EB3|nr:MULTISPECIES: succinic semialdehyde dehydrogenase [unclassified Corynebacterium]MBC3185864.1 succinate-semialdehyde dehydrogenase (NADP(+)) [Corynebacterium sp. zg-331]MPV52355.1 aldehyde dehydrogenase family protein [Corynebacterium sp. zg331]